LVNAQPQPTSDIMDEEILAILIFGLSSMMLVGGFVLRLALKPLVDSIARILELRAVQNRERGDLLERRVALLEQALGTARTELRELRDRDDFYNRLGPGAG
jgi:hypothetical protein